MANQNKRARQKENARVAREAREAERRKQRRNKNVVRGAIAVALVAALAGFYAIIGGGGDDNDPALPEGCTKDVPATASAERETYDAPPKMTIDKKKSYTALVETSCGDFEIALDAQNAPKSVNNFVFLAKQKFFDGLQWPRAAKGFVIQTGSPTNDQQGDAGYDLVVETPKDGQYPLGAVAWGKGGGEPAGTAGSQWFVVTGDQGQFQPEYGYLGMVTSGLENAQKIESLAPESGDGPPTIPMYVNKITITESSTPPSSTAASTTTTAAETTTTTAAG